MKTNQLGTRFLAALLSLVILANCDNCENGSSQSIGGLFIGCEPATLKRNVEAAVNVICTSNTGKTIHSDDIMLDIFRGEFKKHKH